MIPERPVVPLLVYYDPAKPRGSAERAVELGDENYQAIWGLYQYRNKGGPHTVEARILFGTWYNFCGGGRYFSPQVLNYYPMPKEWARESPYCQPAGYGGKTFGNRMVTFEDGFKQASRVIPDLNKILHVESLSQDAAEKIMWDSLAQATLGYMSRSNKRFWVGADRKEGKLSYLTKIMGERGKLPGYMYPIYAPYRPHTAPLTRASFLAGATKTRGTCAYPHETTKVRGTNWNSDSSCIMYTILLSTKGGEGVRYFLTDETDPHKYLARTGLDACCPNCKEDYTIEVTDEGKLRCFNCSHNIPIPDRKATKQADDDLKFYSETLEYVLQKMSAPMYLDHIPYDLWGN